MPTAQETFVSNMSALATAINAKTGVSLPLSITGMTAAINTLAFQDARIVPSSGTGALDYSGGITVFTVDPDSEYTHMKTTYITKPSTLLSENIKQGATIAGIAGNYTYVSQNAAAPAQILSGYKAFVNGGSVMTGTYSVGSYTVSAATQMFTGGASQYVLSKTQWAFNAASQVTIAKPNNLAAANIKSGVNILGITGSYETTTVPLAVNLNFSDGTNLVFSDGPYGQVTVNIPATKAEMEAMIAYSSTLMGIDGKFTSDATATAADIIYSKTAYVKGAKLSGTYKISTATVAAGTLTFSASNKYVVSPPSGYNAVTSVTINQPTNLVAANIKDDVAIAGITGNFTEPGNLAKVSGDTHGGTETANDEIITKDLISNKIAYSKGKKYKGNYWVGSYNASTSDFVFINDSSTLTITINNVSSSDAASSIVLPTASALGLVASNIKKDVTIMGITGTYDNYPTTQQKTVTFSGDGQQVIPDSGKVLSQVTINAPSELVAANIKQGATIAGVAGNFTASDSTSVSIVDSSLSGTWTSANILSGKTAYLHGHKVEGNIQSIAATTYNTSTNNQTIASGKYLSGNQTILAVMTSNLDKANIRYGATVKVGDSNNRSRIAEVNGEYSYVSNSAADASKILFGYKAFVNGGSVMTGTYKVGSFTPPNGSITFNASNQYTITSTDYSAMTSVILNTAALSGWDAAKIAYGKSIGGVSGSYSYVASNAADATKILKDYKAFVNGGTVITGTFTTSSTAVDATFTASSASGYTVPMPTGANALTTVTVNKPANLAPANIRQGKTIAGIAGNYTYVVAASNPATAATILKGYKAFVNGGDMLTGTFTTSSAIVSNLTFSGSSYTVPMPTGADALTTITINKPSSLVAANILSGASIMGVDGSAKTEEQIYSAINSQTFGS